MAAITLKQIAAARDVNYNTTCVHIKQLIEKGLFIKKVYGKKYSIEEVAELEKLLGFTYKEMK
jgi:predicted transcriptional regulator